MGNIRMAELKAIMRGDRWRIQMSWPGYNPRFFGDFDSEAEAERWIKQHTSLAPDTKASTELPDPKPCSVHSQN
jgi:hypothetical protein